MWSETIRELRARGLTFDRGLDRNEIARVERHFDFRFPGDLRSFLRTALPCGPKFPDWRSGHEGELRQWLVRPWEGVLFDVEHGFWLPEWGTRPSYHDKAIRLVTEILDAAPRLIPIFSHRMMPDEPSIAGNPVFSVWQTDIIHYGFDLADYLQAEFRVPNHGTRPDTPREIRFWDPERFHAVRWKDGGFPFGG